MSEQAQPRNDDLRLSDVTKALRPGQGGGWCLDQRATRRVPDPARPIRLRQDHLADDDRRLPDAHRGCHLPGRSRHHQPAARQAPLRHGVPGLRAVPAHDGGRERGLRSRGAAAAASRDCHPRGAGAGTGAATGLRRLQAGAAFRRPAAARGAGPGTVLPARGAAAGRTAGRAGPQAAHRGAGGTRADPPAGRHHLHLRHPRPGGSAVDVGPHRHRARRPRWWWKTTDGVTRKPRTHARHWPKAWSIHAHTRRATPLGEYE